jgi:hypothetical protein
MEPYEAAARHFENRHSRLAVMHAVQTRFTENQALVQFPDYLQDDDHPDAMLPMVIGGRLESADASRYTRFNILHQVLTNAGLLPELHFDIMMENVGHKEASAAVTDYHFSLTMRSGMSNDPRGENLPSLPMMDSGYSLLAACLQQARFSARDTHRAVASLVTAGVISPDDPVIAASKRQARREKFHLPLSKGPHL